MKEEIQENYEKDRDFWFELMRERIRLTNQISAKLSGRQRLALQKRIDELDENMKSVSNRLKERNALGFPTTESFFL
jgi:hypothetical protein